MLKLKNSVSVNQHVVALSAFLSSQYSLFLFKTKFNHILYKPTSCPS